MKEFILTILIGFIVCSVFGQQASKVVHPILMRTCIKSGGKISASDCIDKKIEGVAIMRWDNDKKISVLGRKEDGFGQIYIVVSSKQNEQHGYLEWYVKEMESGEIAVVVFDDSDNKVAITTKSSIKAFYYK